MTKTLEEVLAIEDVATLTDEDKAVLKENEATLTDEQKTKFAPALEVPKTETEEEKLAREEKERGDANEAAGLNRDGSAKVTASEKPGMVMIEASTLKMLENKANEGAQAFKELNATKLTNAVEALVFSDKNKAGTFLPKSKDNLRAFMETLNDGQRASFAALLKDLPKTQIFKEVGAGAGAGEASAKAEIDALIEGKMKANDKLSYAESLKQVMSENPELANRYDEEIRTAA